MIIFNGQTLDDYGICGDPEITTAPFSVTMEDGASFDGARFIGSNLKPGKASFKMAILGDGAERRMTLSRLAQAIKVDEPKPLYLPDSPDWYYLAVPDFDMTPERHFDGEVIDVSFTLIDPVAYGDEKSIVINNSVGTETTFTVGGTYKTAPVLTMEGAMKHGTTETLQIRLDGADFMCVAFPAGTTRVPLVIDCGNRTVMLNNAVTTLSLESDWFELEPGEHTIMYEYGGATVTTMTYRERWL